MELHEVYKVTVPVKAHLTCRPDNGPYYPTDRVEAPRVRDQCGDRAGPRVSTTLFQCGVVKDQDKQHQLSYPDYPQALLDCVVR